MHLRNSEEYGYSMMGADWEQTEEEEELKDPMLYLQRLDALGPQGPW